MGLAPHAVALTGPARTDGATSDVSMRDDKPGSAAGPAVSCLSATGSGEVASRGAQARVGAW